MSQHDEQANLTHNS